MSRSKLTPASASHSCTSGKLVTTELQANSQICAVPTALAVHTEDHLHLGFTGSCPQTSLHLFQAALAECLSRPAYRPVSNKLRGDVHVCAVQYPTALAVHTEYHLHLGFTGTLVIANFETITLLASHPSTLALMHAGRFVPFQTLLRAAAAAAQTAAGASRS